MTRVYLVAGFRRSDKTEVDAWAQRFRWWEERFGDTGCAEPWADVEDAANVTLVPDDRVWTDRFGRIDAFEHGGGFYLVAYS